MKDSLHQLLEEALSSAYDLDDFKDFDGMASVGIKWNPYGGGWEAQADWSSNTEICSKSNYDPSLAVVNLIRLLKEMLETKSNV